MEPPQYEPIATLGKLGIVRGFHFLDPLGGLGYSSMKPYKRQTLNCRADDWEIFGLL